MTASPPPGDDAYGRELLRAIVDGTSDAVVVKDRAGRYLLCNAVAARSVGRAVIDLIGRTDHELFAPEVADAIVAVDRRVLATGSAETVEARVVVDGEPRTRVTTTSAYHGRDGSIAGVISIAREPLVHGASAGHREEDAGESERLLRRVLDALPVGVLVVDANGDIVLGNRTAERIWGQSICVGMDRWAQSRGWWHHSGAAVQPDEWASVRALVDGVPHLDQLIDIEGFDGTRRTIRNSAVPIVQPAGKRVVVLNEDVTERLELEARLVQAQKLDVVGRLVGGVAHDFNNLLMVIMSYADMVAQTLDHDDPRGDDLGEVRRAADSAAALTRQLLAFGRRDVVRSSPVGLETVVASTAKMLARVLGEHIRLITRLAEPPSVVWLDPVQLEQIVVNLAVNARDAMPGGGELAITSRTVERTAAEAQAQGLAGGGRFAVLEVSDTGSGMDERTRARIFEPFFTTKERGRGTGLGLATVHDIVAQCGGAIRVTTAVGRGTTFEIVLPISEVAAAPELAATTTALVGREAILVVEDAAPVRVVVRAMLERFGYAVHAVAGPAAALAHVATGAVIDLLLTDVVLAEASGRALAEAVVAQRPGTPVLYMSGYAHDEVLGQRQLAPDVRILAKPFSAETLARAVRVVLVTRSARPAGVS